MREPATLILDSGEEIRVEVDRAELGNYEIHYAARARAQRRPAATTPPARQQAGDAPDPD